MGRITLLNFGVAQSYDSKRATAAGPPGRPAVLAVDAGAMLARRAR
ncbi:hypothetical protein ACFYRJ_10030 [Streptomyces sp. NPDC005531]